MLDNTEELEEEAPTDDIRAELTQAWDKLEAAQEPAEESPEETPAERKQRERDEGGRFQKQAHKSDQDTAIERPASVTQEIAPGTPATTPVLAPASWAAEERAVFSQLPRNAQEVITRKEVETRRALTRVTEEAANVRKTWGEVEQVLAPHMDRFRLAGISPGRVVDQFMAWQERMDANPRQALRDLAQSYGMNLSEVAQEEPQQPQEPSYVREMRQQLQQIQGRFQSQEQMQEQARYQTIAGSITSFSQERDAQGNALRPYLEAVVEDMVPWVQATMAANPQANHAQVLQAAYDRAVWANPQTRALQLQQQAVQTSPQQIDRAKAAKKIVNGHALSGISHQQPDDIRSQLLARWDELER